MSVRQCTCCIHGCAGAGCSLPPPRRVGKDRLHRKGAAALSIYLDL